MAKKKLVSEQQERRNCYISYQKEQVCTWAKDARACLNGLTDNALIANPVKRAIRREAQECLDLLIQVLSPDSLFDGDEFKIPCKDGNCSHCDTIHDSDEIDKLNGVK